MLKMHTQRQETAKIHGKQSSEYLRIAKGLMPTCYLIIVVCARPFKQCIDTWFPLVAFFSKANAPNVFGEETLVGVGRAQLWQSSPIGRSLA